MSKIRVPVQYSPGESSSLCYVLTLGGGEKERGRERQLERTPSFYKDIVPAD